MFPPSTLWLIAGALFVAIEAFGVPGFGFFFAGLAALGVALIIEMNVVASQAHVAQFAWFFGLTVAWAIVLWAPLKRFHSRRASNHVAAGSLVGDTAVVSAQGLRKGYEGQVQWSGTLMRAELLEGGPLTEGAQVVIVAVEGNKLVVKPK